ncbi:MAG: potassium-transporting ATPase subunit C [Acidimicrobiales bacterium]
MARSTAGHPSEAARGRSGPDGAVPGDGVDPTADIVTTSGSGYDPDITPAHALVQIPRVSEATGIAPSLLRALIAGQTDGPELGFLGSRFIVELQLSQALARLHRTPPPGHCWHIDRSLCRTAGPSGAGVGCDRSPCSDAP